MAYRLGVVIGKSAPVIAVLGYPVPLFASHLTSLAADTQG
jgi:hypothetical protein